jgi:hypothetical protein
MVNFTSKRRCLALLHPLKRRHIKTDRIVLGSRVLPSLFSPGAQIKHKSNGRSGCHRPHHSGEMVFHIKLHVGPSSCVRLD